ncbi:MAG: hypothetical protein ACK5SM_00680 [Sphingomonadales bacterium]
MIVEHVAACRIRVGDLVSRGDGSLIWTRVHRITLRLPPGKLPPADANLATLVSLQVSGAVIILGWDELIYRRGRLEYAIVEAVVPDGLLQPGESLEWRRPKAGEECLDQGTRQARSVPGLVECFVIVRRSNDSGSDGVDEVQDQPGQTTPGVAPQDPDGPGAA